MLKNQFTKLFVGALVVTLFSSAGNASKVTTSAQSDYRNSSKLDFKPRQMGETSLTGVALARMFLAQNIKPYGLESNFNDLRFTKVQPSLLAKHYYFQQYIGDIPVDKAEIIVSVSKQNKIAKVFNNTFAIVKTVPAPNKKLLSRLQAETMVWDFLQVAGKLQAVPKSKLTYLNIGANFALTYKVSMTVTKPFGDWEFYLDATTGKVIKAKRVDLPTFKNANDGRHLGKWKPFKKNLNQKPYAKTLSEIIAAENTAKTKKSKNKAANKADATGLVFDPDPVTTLSNDTLEDTSPASIFDAAYATVTLKDLTLNNGTFSFVGPWVTIADFEDPITPPSTRSDGVWDAKRGDNSFNDAMTYYHLDKNQRYIQSLGFTGATGIQFLSINVDTDGVDGSDNSHFIPGTNQMAFGHGCVDDNEDADVILHEYGHAINFSINPSFDGGDTDAIGEGFGDYWAASYSYSTPNGRSFRPEWVYTWDGHNACWGGRLLNQTSFRYDPTQTYGAHEVIDGVLSDELWSTPLAETLLELLDAGVPRSEVDQIILEAQFGLGSGLTMPDMAASIVNTANTLFPDGDHGETFNKNFRMMEILGDSISIDQINIISAGDDTVVDPGETVSFDVTLKNSGASSLTNVSTTLSSTTAGVSISTPNISYPDIPASQSVAGSTPYQITIPATQSCGSNIDFSLASTYTEGSVVNSDLTFSIPLGLVNKVRQESSPGISIPDFDAAGITDQLTVTNAVAGSSISVDMNIIHTYRGDLVLTLTSPAGTSVVIQEESDDGQENIVGNYPNDFTPSNSLSAFDNENHNGTWTLKVADASSQDTGTLDSWAIISNSPAVCNAPAPPPPPPPPPPPAPAPETDSGGGGSFGLVMLVWLFVFRRRISRESV